MFDVLMLASGLDAANKGGIQYSAELAWAALRQASSLAGRPSALLSYGDDVFAYRETAEGRVLRSPSRLQILGKILSRRWRARRVLVWHLGLMKLLPWLGTGEAGVSVFLHGIEAWRPLGSFTAACLRRADRFLCNSGF